ncbi:MAG: LysR family transcriptional regulator [Pseudomonadota bacterium]
MQNDQIETFLDLAETRSFNRTAERLGVTQSTVSARLAALEKVVGTKLFSRSRAGTDLTTAGLAFAPHARALRHAWTEALRAARHSAPTALTLRIGLQTDLADAHIGDWVSQFRSLFPETSFYLELDYSTQMSADLVTGQLDLAVMYSPRMGPDLYIESVGELRYRLVSSETDQRAQIDPATYIRGSYSAVFEQQHQALFPELTEAPLASGQNAANVGLLRALGGAAFVLEDLAADMVSNGDFALVRDAPPIPQTVYAGIHVRHRHARAYRRLIAIVKRYFGES